VNLGEAFELSLLDNKSIIIWHMDYSTLILFTSGDWVAEGNQRYGNNIERCWSDNSVCWWPQYVYSYVRQHRLL
jgi:hypothetical protein